MKVMQLTILTLGLALSTSAYATDNSACPDGEVISCFADGGCFCARDNPEVEPDAGSAPDCNDADDNGVCD